MDSIYCSTISVQTNAAGLWAKIGKNVYISTETRIDSIPLIEIRNNGFIGPRAVIGAHINHEGGNIKYKGVKVGNGSFIGANSVLTSVLELQQLLES